MVSIALEIEIDGELTEEQYRQGMFILGELVINKIKENIRRYRLIETGQLLQGWLSRANGNTIIIENTQSYMEYLEFGTYEYFQSFGLDKFPKVVPPKKKDIGPSLAKLLPKGIAPFAFVRRVLYNKKIMEELVQQAFS